ncbi:hypothetical protein C1H46_045360 [Malus baccata]|uniref:Uncharacterized protein n=1 Tax=Malus baccata TaxID=106549 RepID=A0A540K4E8_MALBA|nr:hypothetical protein C1H46_045360 [Malus baccata]
MAGNCIMFDVNVVPLHIFFTMPWTPTSEFPHPLSRVKQPIGYRVSYQLVDAFIWLGIRDMTNEFRKKMLKLRPITYLSGYYSSPPDVPILFDYSSFGEHDQYSLWGRNTTITFTRWTGVKQHRVEEKCLSDSLIHLPE